MRAELSAAVAGVIAGMNTTPVTITSAETETLLKAADLVTRARTSVVTDYRGDVIDAHAPEMPTRFAKQLTQILRGGVAIGMDRADALRLAIRCARDSMPPLRLAIIDHLKVWTGNTTQEVRKGIDKPRLTVDRQCRHCTHSACSPVPNARTGPRARSSGATPSPPISIPTRSSSLKVVRESHPLPLTPTRRVGVPPTFRTADQIGFDPERLMGNCLGNTRNTSLSFAMK